MQPIFEPEFINDFFSLQLHHSTKSTQIDMQVIHPIVNTISLPHTYKILEKHLPSIHTSLCFNDKKLPFAKEVRRTEIGHLFEHILLEHIYQLKVSLGHKQVCVRGETSWDWYKHPTGFFSIVINVGKEEKDILSQALIPSIHLLQFIFVSHKRTQVGVKSLPISGKNFTPNATIRTLVLPER